MKRPFPHFIVACLVTGIVLLFTASCTKEETKIKDVTKIVYTNATHTPVHVTVNGATQVVPVLGSVSFSGKPGDSAIVNASTKGSAGATITWNNLNTVFPDTLTGTLFQSFSVDSSYFFLQVANESASKNSIVQAMVYYGLPFQTTDSVSIPPDSVLHGVGYYKNYFDPYTEFKIRYIFSDGTPLDYDRNLIVHVPDGAFSIWIY